MLNDFDDIPVAVREEQSVLGSPGKSNRWVMWGGGLAAAIGLGLGGTVAFLNASSPLAGGIGVGRAAEELAAVLADNNPLNGDRAGLSASSGEQDSFVISGQAQDQDQASGSWTQDAGAGTQRGTGGGQTRGDAVQADRDADRDTVGGAIAPDSPAGAAAEPENEAILGHYPYAEAATAELVSLPDGSGILLAPAAAQAFRTMQQAAQRDGISLVSLSGFRSVETQKELFFGVKAARGQTASERAKVSAPPGHSEHHTGYAIDIGDAKNRSVDLSEGFESTAAFQWLQANAPYYSFELSFPRNNDQGVSYEPWHWRYVGDQASLELFHKGR